MNTIVSYFCDLIHHKKKKIIHLPVYFFLRILSYGFATLVFLRNFFYDKKLFKIKKADLPVISVGNLVVGGGGKTPFLLFLMKHLKHEKIAVVSRGYKSKAEKLKSPLIITDEKTSYEEIGDEMQMMRKHFPNAIYCVGSKRILAAEKAKEKKAKLILLDDGMQHRKLFRDLEIVVVNGKEFLKDQSLFPHGLLREKVKSLKRANFIILNLLDKKNILEIKRKILAFSKAPIIVVNPTLDAIKNLNDEDVCQKIDKAALFCSIANPERFYSLVAQNNVNVVATKDFMDHQKPDLEKIISFAKEAKLKNAQCLLCTEKDAVKLFNNTKFALPIYYLKMSLQVIEGQFQLSKLVEKIKEIIYS